MRIHLHRGIPYSTQLSTLLPMPASASGVFLPRRAAAPQGEPREASTESVSGGNSGGHTRKDLSHLENPGSRFWKKLGGGDSPCSRRTESWVLDHGLVPASNPACSGRGLVPGLGGP